MKPNSSFKPRKRFGQNFLKDTGVIHHIIDVIQPLKNDFIVEIGPGRGALTKPLLEQLQHLDVVEIDRDLIILLESEFKNHPALTIHSSDALQFDFKELYDHSPLNPKKLRIVGNLPYNISTPLIFCLLKLCPLIQDMHFMLQQEVVARIIAPPNSKTYGKLSVMVQYFCQAFLLFSVPAHAFVPPPKVTSAFLRLVPHATLPYPADNFDLFKEVTHTAFQQRRKTIQNSLKTYLTPEDFIKLNISSQLRPEQLSLPQFVAISNFIHASKKVPQ